jgi:hypothetical protein
MSAKNLLSDFVELGYVTSDLDRALALFRSEYGIPDWLEIPNGEVDLGNGRTARLKVAVAYLGKTLIEVQQPLGGEDGWYREVLPEDGFAIKLHHIAFQVPSAEALTQRRADLAGDHAIPYEGRFGNSGYFFADARDRLGVYLEYIYFAPDMDGVIPVNQPQRPDHPAHRLSDLTQLAWVTTDYDRTMSDFRTVYGLEKFFETGEVESDVGQGQIARVKAAIGNLDGMQFEVIAPLSGAVSEYRRGLPADGSHRAILHHMAAYMPDRETLERIRAYAKANGDAVPVSGNFGDSGFFFVDNIARLGHHLEYVYFSEQYCAMIPEN